MADRRPCRVCRRWFDVDPRAGSRHRVCAAESCQKARNSKACAAWRASHGDDVKAYRLRKKLPATPQPAVEVALLDPMAALDPAVVRHAVTVEVPVVLEVATKVALSLARHAVLPKMPAGGHDSPKVPPRARRHETARERGPP